MDVPGGVVSLQDLCLISVGNYLRPSNVWSMFRLVPYVHCKRLEHVVYSYIWDNFMDISHTQQFLALDEKEIQWLVENEEIVASEAAVLDGLARWYKHSVQQRESAFKQFFGRLDKSVIGKDALWQIIKKYKLNKVIPELSTKYKVASGFPPRRFDVDELIYNENVLNVVIFTLHSRLTHLAIYHVPFALRSHYSLRHMLDQEADQYKFECLIPFRDNIFAFGTMKMKGESDSVPVNIRFDFHRQTVTRCTPCGEVVGRKVELEDYPSERVATCGIYMYFLGRVEETTSRYSDKTVPLYRYDTIRDEWKQLASMNTLNDDIQATIIAYRNRYLYVFNISRRCSEKYDIYTNRWRRMDTPSYVWRINKLYGFTMNDKIYLVIDRIIIFELDTVRNIWEKKLLQFFQPLRFWCPPRECFGEAFSVINRSSSFSSVSHMYVVGDMLYEKKKVYATTETIQCLFRPKIVALNRRARILLETEVADQRDDHDLVFFEMFSEFAMPHRGK